MTNGVFMDITVLEVKKAGVNPNQAIALVSVPELEPEPFWYFIALDKEDESEIYKTVMSKINSGEIQIKPTDTNINEYNANQLREERNKLLDQTDKFMVIDSILSDDEIKEMKIYRKSLRDISLQKSFPNVELPTLPSFLCLDSNGKLEYKTDKK